MATSAPRKETAELPIPRTGAAAAVQVEVTNTAIPAIRLIKVPRFVDQRGFFSEAYSKRAFAQAGIAIEFVQDNRSFSIEKGVVRGLHFQTRPFAQDKLISVARGAIFDVAVDLRKASSTFGKHISIVLSAGDSIQVLVPQGFAHGFCTLEPNTEVIYKASNYYSPQNDGGIFWADPELGIQWPISEAEAILSEKDGRLPRLSELREFF